MTGFTTGITVDRVLGGGPFCEVGGPRAGVLSPDGALIVVFGVRFTAQWHATDVSGRSRPDPGWIRFGVYRSADATCLHLLTVRRPVNKVAFHPSRPLVAVGTGSYDGGWRYDGELLILDVHTGAMVSVLGADREVSDVAWRDAETLDLVISVADDDEADRLGTTSMTWSVRRDDWHRATVGMLGPPTDAEPVPARRRGTDPATEQPVEPTGVVEIERWCRDRGLTFPPRAEVWAVEGLAGWILAAHDNVALERWSPSSTEPLWRRPVDGRGLQIRVRRNGASALVLTQHQRWFERPSILLDINLVTGTERARYEPGFAAVLVSRADDWWALRRTDRRGDGSATLFAPDGTHAGTATLGPYDLFNHFFDIRYAPDLLFLVGRGADPWRDKWVVAVDPPDGTARPLFPLEWDAARGAQLSGGCGVYVVDSTGQALIHAGTVHDSAGLRPGNAFVVRRSYPTGGAQWVFRLDHQVTAIVAGNGVVFVTLNTGDLIVLDAAHGAVRARAQLRVDGHPVVPLSLAGLGPMRVAIGTADGRVIDCSIVDGQGREM